MRAAVVKVYTHISRPSPFDVWSSPAEASCPNGRLDIQDEIAQFFHNLTVSNCGMSQPQVLQPLQVVFPHHLHTSHRLRCYSSHRPRCYTWTSPAITACSVVTSLHPAQNLKLATSKKMANCTLIKLMNQRPTPTAALVVVVNTYMSGGCGDDQQGHPCQNVQHNASNSQSVQVQPTWLRPISDLATHVSVTGITLFQLHRIRR